MRVNNTLPLVERSTREQLLGLDFLQEFMVEYRCLDIHVGLSLSLDVEINASLLLGPVSESWVLLSAEVISIAYDQRNKLVMTPTRSLRVLYLMAIGNALASSDDVA